MKIPETNFYCQFLYGHYRLNPKIEIVDLSENGVITEDGEIIPFNELRKLYYATSIGQVPYWRLYVIKFKKNDDGSYTRECVNKSVCNYDFWNVCDLMKRIGNPNDNYTKVKGERYSYECWPRRTVLNRT